MILLWISSLKHGQMCEVSRKTFKKGVGHWTILPHECTKVVIAVSMMTLSTGESLDSMEYSLFKEFESSTE